MWVLRLLWVQWPSESLANKNVKSNHQDKVTVSESTLLDDGKQMDSIKITQEEEDQVNDGKPRKMMVENRKLINNLHSVTIRIIIKITSSISSHGSPRVHDNPK